MDTTAERPKSFISFIVIALLQSGVALASAIRLIAGLNDPANVSLLPWPFVLTALNAAVGLIAIVLVAGRKRAGLIVGLVAWLVSLGWSVLLLISNFFEPNADLRNFGYILSAGAFIIDLFVLFRLYRFLTHAPEKSFFN